MKMKKIRIADIRDRQEVDAVLMVKEASIAETKAGKPYLRLTLMDASGEIAARAWDNAEAMAAGCGKGAVVRVRGQAASFRDQLQLKVSGIDPVAGDNIDPGDFMPKSPNDIGAMAREFLKLADSINDPALAALVAAFFRKRKTFTAFKTAPAAKSMHHAYIGGLLEHTLGVAMLADRVAGIYPAIDRDLLMTGAMLHDIGKLAEFSFDTFPFDYSEAGRLVGHMVLGVEMIQAEARDIKAISDPVLKRLTHLVLSHHGRHEFGSPVLPMILEAFVLNFIDDLDAKVNYVSNLGKNADEDGYHLSEYQRNLERFLFIRRPPAEEAGTPETNSTEIDPRQKILWHNTP